MTGADPAVEAARRAWGAGADWEFNDRTTGGMSLAAAREALAPVRALHYRIDIAATSCVEECEVHEDESPLDVKVPVCRECYRIAEEADLYFSERPGWHEPVAWPCATARLAYTAEELERK